MFSAEPVCAVAFSFVHFAHETAGAARTRHSLRPLISDGATFWKNSRGSCGEIAELCRYILTRRHPRKRVIQYSRDVSDGIEKPRRTGYPAFAGYDDRRWGGTAVAFARCVAHGGPQQPLATGSPEAVARPRLPQNVACGFPAPRSSAVGSQLSLLSVQVSFPWSGAIAQSW